MFKTLGSWYLVETNVRTLVCTLAPSPRSGSVPMLQAKGHLASFLLLPAGFMEVLWQLGRLWLWCFPSEAQDTALFIEWFFCALSLLTGSSRVSHLRPPTHAVSNTWDSLVGEYLYLPVSLLLFLFFLPPRFLL